MKVHERIEEGHWVPPWLRHQHVARYEFAAPLCAGRRVLDAACGIGYGSRRLRAGGALSVDGFDASPEAVAAAVRGGVPDGVRFAVGDATHLPVRDHAYDVYVSLETIEHIDDDRAYLREALRVLRPGGTLVCSTPNRAMLNPGRALSDRPFNPFHVREYVRDELFARLREFFPTVALYGQSPYARPYARVLAGIGARVPMAAVRLHQVRKVLGIPRERYERHTPAALPLAGEPEVLVAVCVAPGG